MISLDILGMCNNCPNFEPIKTNEFETFYNGEVCHNTTVTCEYIDKCKSLLEFLRKEVDKNE